MRLFRRAVTAGLVSAGVFAGSLVLASTPASAVITHPFVSQITEAGGVTLVQPWGLAFDPGGDLLVVDAGTTEVDVFNSANTFTGHFGGEFPRDPRDVGVDDATGDLYVSNPGQSRVDVFEPEGGGYKLVQGRQFPGGGGDYVYATVNNSSGPHGGEVYVIAGPSRVFVMKPNAAGELAEPSEELPPPEEGFSLLGGNGQDFHNEPAGGIAIDRPTGEVYVANPGHGFVDEYNSENVYKGHFNGPPGKFEPVAVAVEDSTGDLYVVDAANNVVDEFDASGKFIGRIAEGSTGDPLSSPVGVAVNASGDVYVSNGAAVDIFGSGFLAPEVTTGATSAIERTSAKFEGVVNPEGTKVESCEFEYGTSTAFGQTTPCVPAPGSGPSPVTVSAEVSGLTLETTYYYRLVAGYAKGLNDGAPKTFQTPGLVPGLKTEAATGVELSGGQLVATLNGSLSPDGLDTHYYFEYGETNAYGSSTPEVDAGSASQLEHAQAQLTGLKPYVFYHFRIVATNSLGTARGADTIFNTAGVVPPLVIGGLPASSVTQFAATLNGTLGTGEALVNYHFEYGTTTAYGQVAPIPDNYAPITTETVPVSQPVGGLQAGTTYHYRLVASSPGGTEVAGPDETFATLPVPAPTVETGAASGVGVGSATLSGTVDPHGWDTTYLFQYGPSTAYGQSWPTVQVDMGALEGSQPVLVSVPGLLPGTTYHYRLLATNSGGTAYGPDMTFTTGEYPAQAIQEPVAIRTLLVPAGGETATSPGKKTKQSKKGKRTKPRAKHGKRGKKRKK
jgi:DNA-binding beta-propeller fold protein YncE